MKFYSETLNQIFDTEDALVAAETAAEEAAAAKKNAAEAKKADAIKVEDAFKARNAAKRTYNSKIMELRQKYNADLLALRKTFEAAMTDAKKELDTAETAYDTALSSFIAKYPEGYHMTLKDGDNVATFNAAQTTDIKRLEKILADREKWFNDIFGEFFRA
jgi:hypothetical protein